MVVVFLNDLLWHYSSFTGFVSKLQDFHAYV
jgi:hypothetical protein